MIASRNPIINPMEVVTDGMEGDADGKRHVNDWKNTASWTCSADPDQVRLPTAPAKDEQVVSMTCPVVLPKRP